MKTQEDRPQEPLRRPKGWRYALCVAVVGAASLVSAPATAASAKMLWVSPSGSDANIGTRNKPVATLQKAQSLVRKLNDDMQADIVVNITDGTYRLTEPLVLTAEDSGSNGHRVIWQAAQKAHPVVSGGQQITGWQVADESTGIWSAPVPADASTRQLYVAGALAPRARTQVTRGDLTVTADGYTIANSRANWLLTLPGIEKAEIRGVGSFTDRYAPIQGVDGGLIRMEQPAWRHNIFGWDHLGAPFLEAGFYVENALSLLDTAGEWFLDEDADTVYYKPLAGQDVNAIDVELPKLESLLRIGGSYDAPAHDISVRGLEFSDTTWRLPSTNIGYADQQTGGFIGEDKVYPAFEASRPFWHQMPSTVQVSAAKNITLTGNTYTDLGASGIGIGNDANAHGSGVGLGTQGIAIRDSVFTEIAGNGITVGGIQADAHHPSDPRMIVKDIEISGNLVKDVAKTYTAGVAIFTTYTEHAVISHNDVHNLPYSGINTGYGWGSNDAGGNPEYERRGLYNYQPKYSTPTTQKNNLIVGNLVYDIQKIHNDGAAFYNLSANPGTVWERNHAYGYRDYGVYNDEGSRFGTFRQNVFGKANVPPARWFHMNSADPLVGNLTATGNWSNTSNTNVTNGSRGNVLTGNVIVPDSNWPLDAYRVVYEAGRAVAQRTEPGVVYPITGHLGLTTKTETNGSVTATATVTNVGTVGLRNLDLTLRSEGFTAKPLTRPLRFVAGGAATVAIWRLTATDVAGSGPIVNRNYTVRATFQDKTQNRELTATSGNIVTGSPVSAPWRTHGSVPAVFGQSGDQLGISVAGADVWGVGQHDDEYGTIYQRKAIDGDGEIVARVDRQDNSNAWAKSGVVLRNDLTGAYASKGYAAVLVTPGNGVVFARDTSGDGVLDAQSVTGGVKAPVWVKITRTGNQASGFYSTDGITWIQIGGAAALTGAEQTLDAGVLHTSHDRAIAGIAEFSRITITP
jgi:hypothetical protein